jgi:hypothetical protein
VGGAAPSPPAPVDVPVVTTEAVPPPSPSTIATSDPQASRPIGAIDAIEPVKYPRMSGSVPKPL